MSRLGSELMQNAANENLDEVHAVLPSGANANITTDEWFTALMEMASDHSSELIENAKNGNRDRILELLPLANADFSRDVKIEALMKASEKGLVALVLAFLTLGDVKANDTEQMSSGETALFKASRKGHADVVKALLEKGAHVNARTMLNDTALIIASAYGHEGVVRALLEHRKVEVDVNAKNTSGQTALIIASENGKADVVGALLEHPKVDLTIKDKYGCTALDVARKQKQKQCTALDVARKQKQCTALDVARKQKQVDVVRLLVKAAGGVDDSDSDDSDSLLLTFSQQSKMLSNASLNAVRRLGTSCVPCRRPCTGIKLLELIDHTRVGYYGFFRHKHLLYTVEPNAKTLMEYFDDDQREQLKRLANMSSKQYILACDVTQSVGLMPALHAEIPPPDADLAKVGLKATHDKSWSLVTNDGRIRKTSVSELNLRIFMCKNDVQRLPLQNGTNGVVTAIYSIAGGLTYTGHSKLVTTGGEPLKPTVTGPVKISSGFEYTVTNSGQVVLCESDPVEWIIGVEFLDLEEIYEQKKQSTQ
jgi:hypothetical protein